MGRRLPAVLLAVLLALATTSCGGSDDESPADGGTATQTDDGTDADTEDSDPGAAEDDKPSRADRREERREERQDRREEREDEPKRDNDSAMPNDLPSEDSAAPEDLPIVADAVMQACEDVDPSDAWPPVDDIYFDANSGNVVATAEVEVKGGDTMKLACDVTGSDAQPNVMAYNPV